MKIPSDDTQKNKGSAAQTTNPKTIKTITNFNDTSAENQQNIILMALREGPKTTIELRNDFGVMMPAARIKELRDQGNKIDTVRVTRLTPDGIRHHAVALYVLRGENHE